MASICKDVMQRFILSKFRKLNLKISTKKSKDSFKIEKILAYNKSFMNFYLKMEFKTNLKILRNLKSQVLWCYEKFFNHTFSNSYKLYFFIASMPQYWSLKSKLSQIYHNFLGCNDRVCICTSRSEKQFYFIVKNLKFINLPLFNIFWADASGLMEGKAPLKMQQF